MYACAAKNEPEKDGSEARMPKKPESETAAVEDDEPEEQESSKRRTSRMRAWYHLFARPWDFLKRKKRAGNFVGAEAAVMADNLGTQTVAQVHHHIPFGRQDGVSAGQGAALLSSRQSTTPTVGQGGAPFVQDGRLSGQAGSSPRQVGTSSGQTGPSLPIRRRGPLTDEERHFDLGNYDLKKMQKKKRR